MHFPVKNSQCLQGIIICGFKCCYFLCQSIRFILLASSLQANCLQNLLTQHRGSCQKHSWQLPVEILSFLVRRGFASPPQYLYRTSGFIKLPIHMAVEENFQMQATSNSVALHFLTNMQATPRYQLPLSFPYCRLKTDQSCQFSFFSFTNWPERSDINEIQVNDTHFSLGSFQNIEVV